MSMSVVKCYCGEWSSEPCPWRGDETETVEVEWMPVSYRASHATAGNSGTYPSNGAQRIRVSRQCARTILESDGDWARVVA